MKNRNSSILAGILVVAIGFVLLIHKLGLFYFPRWFFSWGTLLIAIGLVIGIKKQFTGVGWFILVLIGSFGVLNEIGAFQWELKRYGLPVGIIMVGMFIIVRSLIQKSKRENTDGHPIHSEMQAMHPPHNTGDTSETPRSEGTAREGGDEYIDSVNVFGSNKRKIYSKNFRGGESVNLFGATEIDLTQADIEGTAVIDLVQIFGGVKLIAPSNWMIDSEMTCVFGGLDDKRLPYQNPPDKGKRLVITGVCFFGGVDIKSFR